ncbi:uncharacterized protein LOC143525291 isoform X1 [Brachyhypopomus gauderio]|uniref:uncharacterized protein LOC143525291 isoform X1 n=1 Tax=Brachyhypopomus gauderio TaxID=698409 RepID=UPI0040416A8F
MSFFPRRTDQPRPRQEQNHFIYTPGFTTHGVPYNPQATVIHTDPCGPAPFPHGSTAGPSDVGYVNMPVEGPLLTGLAEVQNHQLSAHDLTSKTSVLSENMTSHILQHCPDMERQRHLAQPHVQGKVLRQMDPVYLQPAGEVGSSRCPPLPVLTSRTTVTSSGLMRPSPPTFTRLPPLPKPAGREPLRAFRPAKGSVEPPQLHSPGWKRERVGRLHRSGRHLQPLLPDIFEAANPSDAGRGLPKSSRLLSGNPPGSFLLPSYPLATLPGVQLTPTLHRRRHKRDTSPRRRDPGPWRDSTGEVGSSRCPPLPVLASRTTVTSSGLMRPSPPTFTRLPPLPKPSGREPLRAFRPAKGSQVQSTRAVPADDMCEGVVGRDELKPGTPREDPHEHQILQPFYKPDLALAQSFRLLSSDDWEKKIEGLMSIRRLAQYHADVLGSRLHDVCIVLIQEVLHLRSAVSRMAVVSLRELYSSLQKGMDQEVEATAKVLLHKAAESNGFIRQDVDTALDSMVQNCTPIRSMNALLAGGLCHLNAAVRKCTARHLATLVEKIGAERIIPAVSKLAQDSSQETRRLGRRMLLFLSSHHDFDKMVEKYIPAKDLATIRDTVLTLKSKKRTKVSRIPRYKMRQPRLEQQEAPAAQTDRQNTQRMKRSLRHTVKDVSPDDAAPLKDLQLNSNVPAQTKTDVLMDDLPTSPSNARTPRSPSPPTAVPTKHLLPRRRRAPSLIRARPSLSNSSVSFTSRYTAGRLLGTGGFGSVYAGVRKADGKQIAIKFVPKYHAERFITVPGNTRRLPLEVALMEMVCKPPRCEHIVELLEWFECHKCFILILERPVPCIDLFDFLNLHQRQLPEPLARRIMRQVVQAVLHCHDRGVLHRDIKGKNLLVNLDTLDVKLIDFGCGDLLKTGPYRHFRGTMVYSPPEWQVDRTYEGRQATIWSLGVLLYSIICGHLPFEKVEDIVEAHLCFSGNPSRDCRHLITWCLQKDPAKRPVLEDVLAHEWFLEGLQN